MVDDWQWFERHAKFNKYLLHDTYTLRYNLDMRKCDDFNCCKPYRSPRLQALLVPFNGFIPPTLQLSDGTFTRVLQTIEYGKLDQVCSGYDLFCPSLSQVYSAYLCPACNAYFPKKIFLELHTSKIHKRTLDSLFKAVRAIDDIVLHVPSAAEKERERTTMVCK